MTKPIRDSKGRFVSSKKQPTPTTTKHDLRGPDGKFISKTKKQSTSKQTKQTVQQPQPAGRTLVHILIDASGSMSNIKSAAVDALNRQIATVKAESLRNKQYTLLSVAQFIDSNRVNVPLRSSNWPEAIIPISPWGEYTPTGSNTPLRDAVSAAIVDLTFRASPEDSVLLIVITDGQENASLRVTPAVMKNKIQKLQTTDRWTFAFSVPRGSKQLIAREFGVFDDNIQEWEQSVQGTEVMSMATAAGTSGYFTARSAGQTSVKKFYTDLSKLDPNTLKRNLQDVSDAYREWTVSKEASITEFVDEKLAPRDRYVPGNAFYELTKPEKVQSYKNILIKDKKTGRIFGGQDVRTIIGLPPGQDCKVEPANLSNYKVFVQSTSGNRKLVRGTSILYTKK